MGVLSIEPNKERRYWQGVLRRLAGWIISARARMPIFLFRRGLRVNTLYDRMFAAFRRFIRGARI